MTRDHEEKLHAAVENLWFKGAARLAMIIVTLIGAPLAYSIASRTYDTIDRLDRSQAKLEAQIERIELTASNDRKAAQERDNQINVRIDIVSGHLTETQRDYARVSDVLAGFTLRDQRIDGIDRRLGGIEARMNGIPRDH